MSYRHLHLLPVFCLLVLLAGCRSKADLENINPQAELDLGVAMPVGSIHATMGDFLGGGQVAGIYVDADGIFHFIDTIDIPTKDYHKIDMTNYVLKNSNPLQFSISDQIDKSEIHSGEEYKLTFDMTLKTENFNTDTKNERIDSLQVSEAGFTSIINVEDFDLSWAEIQKVELELGDQFRRPEGKIITIPVSGKQYDSKIPIDVRNFSLDMMDHENGGTIEKIKFRIHFYVKPNHTITVTENSKFSYDLKVNVIDYDAIWGFFQAGNEMRDSERLDMDSLWENWKNIKKLKVRFMEPVIDVFVTHRIAAPLRMYISYISAIDSAGHATHATWDGLEQTDFDLPKSVKPYSEDLRDSCVNTRQFSYEPSKGHLDKLFDVRPDFFEYGFYLLVDQNIRHDYPWPQHRVTRDLKVRGYAIADVPFKVNTESEMEYTSTIKDVDIRRISIDSLLVDVKAIDTIKASNIKLIIEVENRIPFKLEGQFTFLDQYNRDLKMQVVEDNPDNHLLFPAPKMSRTTGEKYGRVDEPSITRYIINIDKNDFDRLSQVRSIRFDAAMVENPEPCVITDKTDLRVKIGLSAYVDAILKFDSDEKK